MMIRVLRLESRVAYQFGSRRERFFSQLSSRRREIIDPPEASVESQPGQLSDKSVEKFESLRKRRLPLLWDSLTWENTCLLRNTLAPFLPPIEEFNSHLWKILYPGYHLTLFRPPVNTADVSDDGTDWLHSPGSPYDLRVWAGGRLFFPMRHQISNDGNQAVLEETIQDVQVRGMPGQEKVFVKIQRTAKLDATSENTRTGSSFFFGKGSRVELDDSFLVEERDLCFMRADDANSRRSFSKIRPPIKPPTDADYLHTLVPTRTLLFRYSALTFNAHRIHYDVDYTRKVYGLPDLVVHGPLVLTLMLEVLRLFLQKTSKKLVVVEVNYKNLVPVFVDEEMTICCKKIESFSSAISSSSPSSTPPNSPEKESAPKEIQPETWTVWIQKAHQDGQQTVAVRGTVKLEPPTD